MTSTLMKLWIFAHMKGNFYLIAMHIDPFFFQFSHVVFILSCVFTCNLLQDLNMWMSSARSIKNFSLLCFTWFQTCIYKLVLVFLFCLFDIVWNHVKQAIYGWGKALLPAADFASFDFVNISVLFFLATNYCPVVHICKNDREILTCFPTVSICGINFLIRCNEEKPENCLCTCVFTQQNPLICTHNYVWR